MGKKRLCICVKGFDASIAKDDIKTALSNHFGSCGVITYVFVPTLHGTGASRGFVIAWLVPPILKLNTNWLFLYRFAHISMTARDEDKALALDGSLLGGRMLEVRMATFGHPHNRGCKTCPLVYMEGKMEAFHDFNSWEIGQTFKKMCNNPTLNEQEVEQSIHT